MGNVRVTAKEIESVLADGIKAMEYRDKEIERLTAETERLVEMVREAYETDHSSSFQDWLDMNGYVLECHNPLASKKADNVIINRQRDEIERLTVEVSGLMKIINRSYELLLEEKAVAVQVYLGMVVKTRDKGHNPLASK